MHASMTAALTSNRLQGETGNLMPVLPVITIKTLTACNFPPCTCPLVHVTTGTFMQLDTSQVDAMLLFATLRESQNTIKMSYEDKQLVYTAEKIKNMRVFILMEDYNKLFVETLSTDMGLISVAGLDELMLVKKAIDFFENVRRISVLLREGRIRGWAGRLDMHDVSIYDLNNLIIVFNFASCSQSLQCFLSCSQSMRDIRSAAKSGRWNTLALARLLLQKAREMATMGITIIEDGRQGALDSQDGDGESRDDDSVIPTSSVPFPLKQSHDHLFKSITILHFDFQHEMFGNVNHSLRRSKRHNTAFANMLRPHFEYDDAFDFSPPAYKDVPGQTIFFCEAIGSEELDPLGVPRMLSSLNICAVDDVEEEVVLVRDELYNRVSLQLLHLALDGTRLSSGANALQLEAGGRGRDEDSDFDVTISEAIAITEFLGVKSFECLRLLHTAALLKNVRESFASNDFIQTMKVLEQVSDLKCKNLFDSVVVMEVDNIFKTICAMNFKQEMARILQIGRKVEEDEDGSVGDDEMESKDNHIFDDDAYSSDTDVLKPLPPFMFSLSEGNRRDGDSDMESVSDGFSVGTGKASLSGSIVSDRERKGSIHVSRPRHTRNSTHSIQKPGRRLSESGDSVAPSKHDTSVTSPTKDERLRSSYDDYSVDLPHEGGHDNCSRNVSNVTAWDHDARNHKRVVNFALLRQSIRKISSVKELDNESSQLM